MLTLIALAPVMFNFRSIFGIGIYNVEDSFFITYTDGNGGINLHLHLEHEVNDRYAISSWIEPMSTEDVVNYGLNSLNIQYLANNGIKYEDYLIFASPRVGYMYYSFRTDLIKNDNFTCRGTAEVALQAEGFPINETINFQLTFLIPLSRQDLINIDLAIYSLFFLYFFLYVIVPVVLVKIFKPVLGFKYREDDVRKDENFLNFIRGQADKNRKENNTD